MEDEKHFIIDCDFYDQERNGLSLWFLTVKNKDFNQLDLNKKREILLNLILHVSTCSSSFRIFIQTYDRAFQIYLSLRHTLITQLRQLLNLVPLLTTQNDYPHTLLE